MIVLDLVSAKEAPQTCAPLATQEETKDLRERLAERDDGSRADEPAQDRAHDPLVDWDDSEVEF